MDQPLRIVSARFFPSGVSAGSRPDGGSTISVVCRCGVLGSVTPERRARPNSPFSISALLGSMRPAATSSACLYSASVRHALFMSHGPPRPPMALAHRSSGMPAACIMFSVAVMSGSPQGVRGCCQPLGVSMKWLASLGGPTMDWPYVVATKIVAAAAPSSTLRILSIIRYIVTPVAPAGRESPAAPSKVTCAMPPVQGLPTSLSLAGPLHLSILSLRYSCVAGMAVAGRLHPHGSHMSSLTPDRGASKIVDLEVKDARVIFTAAWEGLEE